jgi:hypothetical protein
MALTPEEERELAQLEAEFGLSAEAESGLSAEEEKELAQLEAEFGPESVSIAEPKFEESSDTRDLYKNIDQFNASQLLNQQDYRKPRDPRDALVAMDPTIAAGTNIEKNRREYELPRLHKLLSETLEIPMSDVDITNGMPAGDRFKAGTMKTDEDKFKYYYDKYGEEGDVRTVFIGDEPRIVVSDPTATGGKYVLADEYGASPSDILDVSRDVMLTGGEVTGAAILTFLTGGSTSAYPILRGSLGSGAGAAITDFINEQTYESANEAEYQVLNDLGQSLKLGTITSLLDSTIGGGFKYGTKALKDFKSPSYRDDAVQRFDEAVDRLSRRRGVEFPETAATKSGQAELFETQAKITGSITDGAFAALSRKTERARDVIYNLKQSMFGGKAVHYDETFRQWANSQRDEYISLVREVQEFDPRLARQLASVVNDRISRLDVGSAGSMTKSTAGNKIRGSLQSEYTLRKDTLDKLYEDVYTQADSLGIRVGAKEAGDKILSAVNKMNVPRDIKDQVVGVFLPGGARSVRREGAELAREEVEFLPYIAKPDGTLGYVEVSRTDALKPLTLKQIDDRRKALYKVIDGMGKRGEDTSELMKVYNELDGIMGKAISRGGDELVNAHKNTINYFKANVLPFRSKGVGGALRTGDTGEYIMGSQQLANQYFSGGRALENVQELKKVIGKTNPEAMQSLRDGYINHVLGNSLRTDGTISWVKLKNLVYDKDVAREILGENQELALKSLDDIMTASNMVTKKLEPEQLKAILEAKTPQDIREIAKTIQAQAARQALLDNVTGKNLLKSIQDGTLDFQSPEAFIASFRQLNKTEALKIMDKIPDQLTRDSFRAKVIQDLFDMASEGSGPLQRTSKKFSRAAMWDPAKLDKELSRKEYREMLEGVLGKQTMRDILDLNTALKGYMRSKAGKSSLLVGDIRSRSDSEATPLLRIPIDAIGNRLMSLVLSSKSAGRLISDSGNIDQLINNMIPALMATDNGLDLLFNEAAEDPRMEAYISDYFNNE